MFMRQKLLPAIALSFGLLSLSGLLCPALMEYAAAQAPTLSAASGANITVNPLFHSLLSRLQTTARIPILLPLNIPGQNGPLVADLGVGDGQYTISVHRAKAGRRLDFSNQVATISGMRPGRREYPLTGKSIALAGGVTGRYLGERKSAPYAFLQWHQQGCVYDIGLVHGTQTQMKAMADWAIRHPLPPLHS